MTITIAVTVSCGKLYDVLWKHLIRLLDDVIACPRNPNVIAILVVWSGRLFPKCEAADQHVLAASAVANGYGWILCKVLTSAVHLPTTPALVETVFANGENGIWVCSMKSFKTVCLTAHDLFEAFPSLSEEISSQRVVNLPGLQKLTTASTHRPHLLQACEIGCTGILDRHPWLWHLLPLVLERSLLWRLLLLLLPTYTA
jgi:hypothetical protein